jgi:hypothetical protein
VTAGQRIWLTVYRKPVSPRPRLSVTAMLASYRKPVARRRLSQRRLPVGRKVPRCRGEVRAGPVTIYGKPVACGGLARSGLASVSELATGPGHGAHRGPGGGRQVAGHEVAGSGVLTAGNGEAICWVLAAKGWPAWAGQMTRLVVRDRHALAAHRRQRRNRRLTIPVLADG